MRRDLVAIVLMALCCAACATVEKVSRDAGLTEAQQAFDEGRSLWEAGRYAEATPLAEHALELREAVLGRTHLEVASCLNLLGIIHLGLGNYERAKSLLHRALAIRATALGKSHPDVAQSLHSLATVYRSQGHYARAESLYERALTIREATLGKSHPDFAHTLYNLATIYHFQGHYARAKSLYERALAIQEAALGKNHPRVADSLQALAVLHKIQGNYAQSERLYESALAIREAIHGPKHPSIAALLNNSANLSMLLGYYERAEIQYERALAIQQEILSPNHPDLATALHNVANLYHDQGAHAKAEPLLQRAVAIGESTLGKNHPATAKFLSTLASLYLSQGHYDRAKPLYERALAIRETALGKNHLDVADSLDKLSQFYAAQGDYEKAEPLLQRALAIGEEALGQNHPEIAKFLNNLATLYARQGHYEMAEPLYERARSIQEAVFGKNHKDITDALHNLALLHYYRGDYKRAEPLYERVLASWEATRGKNHPLIARLLNDLAQFRLAQQNIAEALPLFERAFSASEAHLRQELFALSEARLASVLQLLHVEEERLYALVHAYPDNERARHLALTAAILRKGRSVEELANTSRIIYRSLDEADRDDFQRLRVLRTHLSTLSLAGPGHLSPADYQQRLKELANQGDTLETGLVRRSERMRMLLALPSPSELLNRVAVSLPKDSALIEFIVYRNSLLVPTPGTTHSQSPSDLRYLALLLFPDGSTHALDIGPAEPIDRAAQRLHGALAGHAVSYQLAAQELYTLTFPSLTPLLGKVKRLLLAPDGQLALVPLAALHDGKRFLIDAWDITYLTSGRDLLRSKTNPSAHSVVVLANPDFLHSTDLADQPWTPLPGTQKEAEAIQRLLPQAQLLLGPDATKEALLKLETPGVLHVATHGFFLEDAPTAKDARAVAHFGVAAPLQRPADPLLRSGLVLASARAPETQHHDDAQRRNDSLVTALELAGMDMWGTQLVVLSACDTGQGAVKLGQGVYGLRRSLVAAGAETVVTSLWKVNDETTVDLMEAYYRRLLAGQGRAAALREAMQEFRQKKSHPHYWAPFIAIGQNAPLRGLTPDITDRPAL